MRTRSIPGPFVRTTPSIPTVVGDYTERLPAGLLKGLKLAGMCIVIAAGFSMIAFGAWIAFAGGTDALEVPAEAEARP